MSAFRKWRMAGLLAIGAGAVTAASPAAANRCGGSYPVDTPTTLADVAKRCNVGLADLREANPGVDPSDVRPGEYLALPDEIDEYAPSSSAPPAPETQTAAGPAGRTPFTDDTGMTVDDVLTDVRGGDGRAAHRIRVRDHNAASGRPIWLAPEAPQGGRYSATGAMSYQKLSAARIHNAGVASPTIRFTGAPPSTPTPSMAPGVRLVNCTLQEKSKTGVSAKIRNIITTPAEALAAVEQLSEGDEFSCTLTNISDGGESASDVPAAHYGTTATATSDYRLPDYGKIGIAPSSPAPRGPATMTLTGEIVDSYEGCLLLQTGNGGLWRVSADRPTEEWLGKSIMVWGSPVVGGVCGEGPSMAVSRAVYAEPWPAKK